MQERFIVADNIGAVPGEKIQVFPGDKVQVTAQYEYRGGARTDGKLYVAIGTRRALIGFDEILIAQAPFDQPASVNFATFNVSVTIPITSALAPGVYDMYAKITGMPGIADLVSPDVAQCIEMVAVAEFRSLKIAEFKKV